METLGECFKTLNLYTTKVPERFRLLKNTAFTLGKTFSKVCLKVPEF